MFCDGNSKFWTIQVGSDKCNVHVIYDVTQVGPLQSGHLLIVINENERTHET